MVQNQKKMYIKILQNGKQKIAKLLLHKTSFPYELIFSLYWICCFQWGPVTISDLDWLLGVKKQYRWILKYILYWEWLYCMLFLTQEKERHALEMNVMELGVKVLTSSS